MNSRLLWRFEALGLDLFVKSVRLMGVDCASDFGGWFGPISGAHKIATCNLKLAFPEKTPTGTPGSCVSSAKCLGCSFAEFPLMDKILPSTGRVEVVNKDRVAEVGARNTPMVFVSGHLSNWEVMRAAIVDSGVTCEMTYRAANNPPNVDKRIRDC